VLAFIYEFLAFLRLKVSSYEGLKVFRMEAQVHMDACCLSPRFSVVRKREYAASLLRKLSY